jgi:excisionase family DNA binding protein
MSTEGKRLTREEAAEYLGVTVSYLENLARERKPPRYYRIGSRTIRYEQADLDAFLEARRVNDDAEPWIGIDLGVEHISDQDIADKSSEADESAPEPL